MHRKMICFNQRGPNRPKRQQDSGWSYLVCACAFVCQAGNMGLIMSFGVLFPVIMERFNSKRQDIAWISSLAYFLLLFSSPVAGRLSEKFTCRFVTILGVLSATVGLVLASFAKSAFVYYLTYSLFVGFGICCVRVSNFLIVSKYFCKRKPFATGILTSAAGMGLFVFAPLTESLLDRFGLEKTLRFLGGTVFVTGIPALAYDPNVQENESNNATIQLQQEKFNERTQTKLVDCSVWRVPTFTVFALTFALDRFGQSPTRTHLVKYAEEQGLPADSSSRLLMYFGLASCIARLVAGCVCDLTRVNPRYVFQVGSLITAVSVILLPLANSQTRFILFSVFFGIGNGITLTSMNVVLLNRVEAKRRASAFGLANFLSSFSVLSSPPLIGFIADEFHSYKPAFYLVGSVLLASTALPFVIFCVKVNRRDEREPQTLIMPVENHGQIQYVSSC